jgi:hypothetical protein
VVDQRHPLAAAEPVERQRRDVWKSGPGRLKIGAEGDHQEHWQLLQALDDQRQQFERRGHPGKPRPLGTSDALAAEIFKTESEGNRRRAAQQTLGAAQQRSAHAQEGRVHDVSAMWGARRFSKRRSGSRSA